ncbi:D-alanyl-D-alanine carboxypeptidase [Nocardioides cavernae]|uniref:D-alanyl-D-alanine carboxypeptidase n=1 Tax=Nocardioides cavernae TaxID=1921566 RepID=A0A7Y9GZC6_9ACTN|nr:serine hydrolase domain-containing protein [Nocardioides cavernae]NYE35087.1 D-alanyl-D-alanine carboxypeptidase [Nocardioides cavernae]
MTDRPPVHQIVHPMHRAPRSASPRRRAIPAAAAAVALLAAPLAAAPSAGATTSPAATAAAPKAPRTSEMPERKLERLVQRLRTEGRAVAVTAEVRRGGRTWSFDVGQARRDPGRRVEPGSTFRAASVTKQLVAVLGLQQVERGRWTLDTTIGDVDPALWPGRESVTLRQLLSHTSGMPDYLLAVLGSAVTGQDLVDAVSTRWTDRRIIAAAQGLPGSEPGGFAYSNTNYVVVGQMLERATGTKVRALVRDRVLRPAGMTDSAFAVRKDAPRPDLHEYARYPGSGTLDLGAFEPSLFSSAGALVSTARDLNRFRKALETGKLIPKRLVRTMQEPLSDGGGLPYGLGSYRLPSPCASGPGWVQGHDGASFGTLTFSVGLGTNRQVTIAMTGRGYTERTALAQARLVQQFAYTALSATCGEDGTDERRATQPLPGLIDARLAGLPAT